MKVLLFFMGSLQIYQWGNLQMMLAFIIEAITMHIKKIWWLNQLYIYSHHIRGLARSSIFRRPRSVKPTFSVSKLFNQFCLVSFFDNFSEFHLICTINQSRIFHLSKSQNAQWMLSIKPAPDDLFVYQCYEPFLTWHSNLYHTNTQGIPQ